ncbi:uncharacterized protein BT62DRAFT_935163, partial [Guyanagaster necrorhizus]
LDFTRRLRRIYDRQPIFVFTPWGWPAADGQISYYYNGRYEQIVNMRTIKISSSSMRQVGSRGMMFSWSILSLHSSQYPLRL